MIARIFFGLVGVLCLSMRPAQANFRLLETAAPEVASPRPVRVGLCAGVSSECVGLAVKAEFVAPSVGLSVGIGRVSAGAALKVYAAPRSSSAKPYAYAGWWAPLVGAGLGMDLTLGRSGRGVLQLSAGIVRLPFDQSFLLLPAGQAAVFTAF